MSKGTIVIATIAFVGVLAGVFAAFQYNSATTTLFSESDLNTQAMQDLWSHWKMAYGKSYATEALEATKFATFSANYLFILNWNADPTVTSWVGINEFADMNSAEFHEWSTCLSYESASEDEEVMTPMLENTTVFASVNWVTAGAVTPVKNQGSCGSCWAFSATGSLEGVNWIFNGKSLQSYSEQQLVDCSGSYGNQGCNGGWPHWALAYTQANGIELEATYPYTGQDGTCSFNKGDVAF